jgi:predicted nucleotide-binding protein
MDKKETIQFLKEKLSELYCLETLPYNNDEYPLWHKVIEGVLRKVFGIESPEYREFAGAYSHASHLDEDRQQKYLEELKLRETAILSIIKVQELVGIDTKSPTTVGQQLPKAFIAHGGKSEARDKLCRFLTALGVTPLIVEEQPSENRSVGENVDHYARQCDFAIILATKGDIDIKTRKFIPRGNVLIEIGKSQELFKNRIIYLLQAGAQLPTDISEKVRARFTPQRMDDAFTAIARELTAFGILRAIKSQE